VEQRHIVVNAVDGHLAESLIFVAIIASVIGSVMSSLRSFVAARCRQRADWEPRRIETICSGGREFSVGASCTGVRSGALCSFPAGFSAAGAVADHRARVSSQREAKRILRGEGCSGRACYKSACFKGSLRSAPPDRCLIAENGACCLRLLWGITELVETPDSAGRQK